MNISDKPEVAKPGVNIRSIVKNLNEIDGGLPEGIDEIDPIVFVKELARYRQKAIGTSRHKNVIMATSAKKVDRFLAILKEAQPEVTGKVMEQAINALRIYFNYSGVSRPWLSSKFMPILLPNGAIGVMNEGHGHFIYDQPIRRLNICNSKLRTELDKIMRSIDQHKTDEAALIEFSIIHRQSDGTFVRTRRLPEQLSDWGQTLVFIKNSMDLSASTLFSDEDFSFVFARTSTDIAIIRIYADFALVYGTADPSLIDDDWDPDDCSIDYDRDCNLSTILKNYYAHVFQEIDEPVDVKISNIYEHFQTSVISRTKHIIEQSALNRPDDGIMQYYFDYITLSGKNPQSSARRRAQKISSLTPFFHESQAQPVEYGVLAEDQNPYWILSEEFEHKLAVVSVPMRAFYDIDDFEHNFLDLIESRLFDAVDMPSHQTLLLTGDIARRQGKDYAHTINSEVSQIWIKSRSDEMREQLNHAMLSEPGSDESELKREMVISCDVKVIIALIFDDKPNYVYLNEVMKHISWQFDDVCYLWVPSAGFAQGYDCGSYDTGNAPVLLTYHELEYMSNKFKGMPRRY